MVRKPPVEGILNQLLDRIADRVADNLTALAAESLAQTLDDTPATQDGGAVHPKKVKASTSKDSTQSSQSPTEPSE